MKKVDGTPAQRATPPKETWAVVSSKLEVGDLRVAIEREPQRVLEVTVHGRGFTEASAKERVRKVLEVFEAEKKKAMAKWPGQPIEGFPTVAAVPESILRLPPNLRSA